MYDLFWEAVRWASGAANRTGKRGGASEEDPGHFRRWELAEVTLSLSLSPTTLHRQSNPIP